MQQIKKNKVVKQQLRRLITKMEKSKAKKDATGKSKANDVLELERTKQGSGKQLTLKGTLALAIRRNFGNAATADVGAMLLEDISRFTVARAETKAGTCLIASARIFFHWVYSELIGPHARLIPIGGSFISSRCYKFWHTEESKTQCPHPSQRFSPTEGASESSVLETMGQFRFQ